MYKILLSILLFSTVALAHEEKPSYYDDDGNLVVTLHIHGLRTASDQQHKTYSYDVVNPENLNESTSLNIVTSGPKNQLSSTFTRGTDSDHTLITLNGIGIKDRSTTGGTDDIGQHGTLGTCAIEIIKGPMGTVYGAEAIGGVINMKTCASDENSISLDYGSHNTWNKTIKLGTFLEEQKTILDFRIEDETSDGISVYPQGAEKDPYDNRSYFLNTETTLDNGYTLGTIFIDKQNDSSLDNSGSDNLAYTSEWNFKNQQINYFDKDTHFTFNNSDHKRSYLKSGDTDLYESNVKTFHVDNTKSVNDNLSFTSGFDHEITDVNFNTNIGAYVPSVNKKSHLHGYSGTIDYLINDTFLTYGIRYDDQSRFGSFTNHRYGFEHNGIRGSISTGHKAPTLYEMYGTNGYGFSGNENAKPEESKSYEIGYKKHFKETNLKSIDIAIFQIDIENLLDYQDNTIKNISGKSTRHGAEMGLTYDINNFIIKNNTSWIVSEGSNGTTLRRKPKWINNTSIYTEYKGYNLTSNINYYGEHLDVDSVTYATIPKSEVTTVDFGVSKYIGDYLIYSKLNNAFDEDYERPDGYNQDGRNFNFGIKKKF